LWHRVFFNLGVETQRQWSDLAIARTTPVLALLSLLCLMVHRRRAHWPTLARFSASQPPETPTILSLGFCAG